MSANFGLCYIVVVWKWFSASISVGEEKHKVSAFSYLEFFVNVLVDLFAVDAGESAKNDYGRFGLTLRQKPPVTDTIASQQRKQ